MEDIPHHISQSPQYRKLFKTIHRSHEKDYGSKLEAERDEKIKRVRETIFEKIKRNAARNDFEARFRVKTTRNFMKGQIKQNEELVGLTKIEEN